jgi:hypothetical protein
MPSTKLKRVAKLKLDDELESTWRAETRAIDERNQGRYEQHQRRVKQGKRVSSEPEYEPWPPPLPDFGSLRSSHVRGEVLGRFVVDPAQNVAHDVSRAQSECNIDDLNPRVFVHFAGELAELYPDVEACPRCLGS